MKCVTKKLNQDNATIPFNVKSVSSSIVGASGEVIHHHTHTFSRTIRRVKQTAPQSTSTSKTVAPRNLSTVTPGKKVVKEAVEVIKVVPEKEKKEIAEKERKDIAERASLDTTVSFLKNEREMQTVINNAQKVHAVYMLN